MEGFWGILKREMYYGKKFTSKGDLITAVESYIRYYNTERIQRKLAQIGRLDALKCPIQIRNYATDDEI